MVVCNFQLQSEQMIIGIESEQYLGMIIGKIIKSREQKSDYQDLKLDKMPQKHTVLHSLRANNEEEY